jgi:hypothetical protein
MSEQMAAIVGFVPGEVFMEPAMAELPLTPDGDVLAVPVCADRVCGQLAFLLAAVDMRANLERLAMAARVDKVAWAALAELLGARTDLVLDAPR